MTAEQQQVEALTLALMDAFRATRLGAVADELDALAVAEALAPVVAAQRDAAVREARARALREAAAWLPSATEGPLRVGTALWPECDRDAYSLAIEEAQVALRSRADRIAALGPVDAPEVGAWGCNVDNPAPGHVGQAERALDRAGDFEVEPEAGQ